MWLALRVCVWSVCVWRCSMWVCVKSNCACMYSMWVCEYVLAHVCVCVRVHLQLTDIFRAPQQPLNCSPLPDEFTPPQWALTGERRWRRNWMDWLFLSTMSMLANGEKKAICKFLQPIPYIFLLAFIVYTYTQLRLYVCDHKAYMATHIRQCFLSTLLVIWEGTVRHFIHNHQYFIRFWLEKWNVCFFWIKFGINNLLSLSIYSE
jgi:hypothetical protein